MRTLRILLSPARAALLTGLLTRISAAEEQAPVVLPPKRQLQPARPAFQPDEAARPSEASRLSDEVEAELARLDQGRTSTKEGSFNEATGRGLDEDFVGREFPPDEESEDEKFEDDEADADASQDARPAHQYNRDSDLGFPTRRDNLYV